MKLGDKLTVKANPELYNAGQTGTICSLDLDYSPTFDVRLRFGPSDVCAYAWDDLIDPAFADLWAPGLDDKSKRYS